MTNARSSTRYPRHEPTEQERDEKIALGADLGFEEAAKVLVAVKPGDLPTDGEPEAGK